MPRPSPAKFELLVRRDGEDDCELRQVASVIGYLNSRPRRLDQASYEISELRSRVALTPGFILKNRTTDRFLLLSAHERFLWDQMDGTTSLQEIATAYVLEYGEFDFDIIPNLLRKLQRAQLLTFEPRSRLRQALARNRGRFSVKAIERALTGLACIRYRRRVREFGFTFLHGFVPTFYVDITDIFMASRRARVVAAVTGALVHLVLGAVGFIVAAHAPVGRFTQAFAAASGIIQWQALVIALYPFCFIEMDGYHVLVDVLGVPTLKHDAIAYMKGLLSGAGRMRQGREEVLWT